eukprot:8615376-Karenia_brevis.AAC.1
MNSLAKIPLWGAEVQFKKLGCWIPSLREELLTNALMKSSTTCGIARFNCDGSPIPYTELRAWPV